VGSAQEIVPLDKKRHSYRIAPAFALECRSVGKIATVENLFCFRAVQSKPVVPSPTKHAANGTHRKQGQQAIERE
jgi:hypothetical protein